jgi:hypothetical protein
MSGYEPPKPTQFPLPNSISAPHVQPYAPPINCYSPRSVHVKPDAEPLEFWRAIYTNPELPMFRRMEAAIAALPYCHFNLAAKEFRDLSPAQLKRIRDARVRRERALGPRSTGSGSDN